LRTLERISAGSELTVHYRMDMAYAADWYLDSWDRHTRLLKLTPDKVKHTVLQSHSKRVPMFSTVASRPKILQNNSKLAEKRI
jgi:hypothetical protein